MPSHADRQGFLPCLRATWEVDFEPEIARMIRPEDHVVQKHRASAFYNTNLETKLRMLGTQVLIIAGCNTEFCVEGTVRDAYARDLDLVVPRECVAGIQAAFHEDSLRKFQAYFAEVVPLADMASLFT
jgi:ureidoacrylate peracid hydrolase